MANFDTCRDDSSNVHPSGRGEPSTVTSCHACPRSVLEASYKRRAEAPVDVRMTRVGEEIEGRRGGAGRGGRAPRRGRGMPERVTQEDVQRSMRAGSLSEGEYGDESPGACACGSEPLEEAVRQLPWVSERLKQNNRSNETGSKPPGQKVQNVADALQPTQTGLPHLPNERRAPPHRPPLAGLVMICSTRCASFFQTLPKK